MYRLTSLNRHEKFGSIELSTFGRNFMVFISPNTPIKSKYIKTNFHVFDINFLFIFNKILEDLNTVIQLLIDTFCKK